VFRVPSDAGLRYRGLLIRSAFFSTIDFQRSRRRPFGANERIVYQTENYGARGKMKKIKIFFQSGFQPIKSGVSAIGVRWLGVDGRKRKRRPRGRRSSSDSRRRFKKRRRPSRKRDRYASCASGTYRRSSVPSRDCRTTPSSIP